MSGIVIFHGEEVEIEEAGIYVTLSCTVVMWLYSSCWVYLWMGFHLVQIAQWMAGDETIL